MDDRLLQGVDIDGMEDSELKSYLVTNREDIYLPELVVMLAKEINVVKTNGSTTPAPTEPSTPMSATEVFSGVADAGQNIHGAKNTVTGVLYGGANAYVAADAGQVNVSASVAVTDSAANNRSTYMLTLVHKDLGGAEKYTYPLDSMYIRDDASTYDSGLMAGNIRLFLEAGDTIEIQVVVMDAQTGTATALVDTTWSKLKIDRIS